MRYKWKRVRFQPLGPRVPEGARFRAAGRSHKMTYAHRAIYDADSHIMELPDFLQKYADPSIRDEVPAVSYSASIVTDEEVAVIMGRGGRHSDEHLAAMRGLGNELIAKSKEIHAQGGIDGRAQR